MQRLTKGWRSCGIGRNAPMCRTGRFCRPFSLRCPVKMVGPTLPARGAADVLRCRPVADVLPVVLPARAADVLRCRSTPGRLPPRSRPRHSGSVAGPVVLPTCCAPGRLPTCCPWCCRPVNSRPVAPRSRPVTREALPAPWCCPVKIGPTRSRPVVLPTCCAAGRLPTCCPWCCRSRSAPRSRPRGAAGAIRAILPSRFSLLEFRACRDCFYLYSAKRSVM